MSEPQIDADYMITRDVKRGRLNILTW